MSDTSQGTGWWLASDGKWYPPQPPAPPPSYQDSRVQAKAASAQAKALRPWYRKKRFILPSLVLLVIIVAVAASGGKKTPPTSANGATVTTQKTNAAASSHTATTAPAVTTTSDPTNNGTPKLNQPAYDGDFKFVVTSVQCGASAADAISPAAVPAGAQECIVTMTVEADKSQAQTFFDSNQYAYDSAGRQFSADSNAIFYVTNDQDATQVNPGITITAEVPFQLPANDSISYFELHDSAFSGGVKVDNVG